MKRGWGEIPEKTRRPTASSGTIPTCENQGSSPVSHWWEASSLTAQPPPSLALNGKFKSLRLNYFAVEWAPKHGITGHVCSTKVATRFRELEPSPRPSCENVMWGPDSGLLKAQCVGSVQPAVFIQYINNAAPGRLGHYCARPIGGAGLFRGWRGGEGSFSFGSEESNDWRVTTYMCACSQQFIDVTKSTHDVGQLGSHLPLRRTRFDSRRFRPRTFAPENRDGDAAVRRVFLEIPRFSRPCIPALLHTHVASSSSDLKTPEYWAAPEREIPEKTLRPTASSGTIPTCENPVTRAGD
ncbi:hypothetical protein PR048_010579 [Dryococelus australis]|uniref:Uncharacterized protein n=1 Tax=Dryococelus australis TaxID=614101 RepID=A0ABQ9I477_9NEOP|nr:hypothetical protein PR048_010579 [Dryococelus australis]